MNATKLSLSLVILLLISTPKLSTADDLFNFSYCQFNLYDIPGLLMCYQYNTEPEYECPLNTPFQSLVTLDGKKNVCYLDYNNNLPINCSENSEHPLCDKPLVTTHGCPVGSAFIWGFSTRNYCAYPDNEPGFDINGAEICETKGGFGALEYNADGSRTLYCEDDYTQEVITITETEDCDDEVCTIDLILEGQDFLQCPEGTISVHNNFRNYCANSEEDILLDLNGFNVCYFGQNRTRFDSCPPSELNSNLSSNENIYFSICSTSCGHERPRSSGFKGATLGN
ncbi:hypothetical protein [Pleionea sediminis]|uniref:hypothetical protein n=1 Tax=Pleionea sediminis TaxID=2569479 RepID=UPI001185C1E9|nr:hypothetical protein [Pleionea sediminis]